VSKAPSSSFFETFFEGTGSVGLVWFFAATPDVLTTYGAKLQKFTATRGK
jgi:hypothetical protein